MYKEVCAYLIQHEGASIASALKSLEKEGGAEATGTVTREVSTVTRLFERLEERYGVTLVEVSKHRPFTVVTPTGRRVYENTCALLAAYAFLQHQSFRPKVVVGTGSFIMSQILPGPVVKRCLEDLRKTADVEFVESDPDPLVEKVRQGQFDFGIEGHIALAEDDNVLRMPLLKGDEPIEIDRVLVCHPNHPFAERILKQQPIPLADLASEAVCVIPEHLRGGYTPLPDPTAEGSRMLVSSVPAVLAFAKMGVAVGIVPGVYGWLDDLRKQGLILYAPLAEKLQKARPCVYLRKVGRSDDRRAALDRLSKHAQVLFQAIEEQFGLLPLTSAWNFWVNRKASLPTEKKAYDRFEHVYYVSRPGKHPTHDKSAAPLWFRSTLKDDKEKNTWTVTRGVKGRGTTLEFCGSMRDRRKDYDIPGFDDWECDGYKLLGELIGEDVLYLRGLRIEGKTKGGGFVAAFNTYYTNTSDGEADGAPCLLGTWTSIDGNRWPTSAPMVLSSAELTLKELREITRTASYHYLPDAEETWPGWKKS
jgi:DNA-binding transcriptional LysR family regulator